MFDLWVIDYQDRQMTVEHTPDWGVYKIILDNKVYKFEGDDNWFNAQKFLMDNHIDIYL